MLTCTREELECWVDMIRATKGSHAKVDYSTYTLSVYGTICKRLSWLPCNKFLKIQTGLLWTLCIGGVGPYLYS